MVSDNNKERLVVLQEIVESLEIALDQFRRIEDELQEANNARLPVSLLLIRLPAREAVRAIEPRPLGRQHRRGQAAIRCERFKSKRSRISTRLDAALHGSRAFRTIRRARWDKADWTW